MVCLMVDQFVADKGYLPLVTSNIAEGDFVVLKETEYDLGGNKKRHGSVLTLTKQEYDALSNRYLGIIG